MTYKKEIRRMRWLAAMLLLVAAMVVPTMAWAQDSFSDGDFLYLVTSTDPENQTVEVSYYTGSGGVVNIPAMVENNNVVYSVTSIGGAAFASKSTITAITGGENIKVIGAMAFSHCTSLTSVDTLLNNITSIPDQAFYSCTSLQGNIKLDRVTSIGYEAFSGCNNPELNLKLTNLSNASIGNYAFETCIGLRSVTGTAQSIAMGAFSGCSNLTYIGNLLDKFKTIPSEIFVDCTSLKGDITLDSITSIGASAFAGCNNPELNLTFTNLNNATIGEGAFYHCSGLKSISGKAQSIGLNAFWGCTNLTSIGDLLTNVTTIPWSAFYNCSGLTGRIKLGAGITEIEEDAFCGCSSLVDIRFTGTVPPTIGEGAFGGIHKDALITVPALSVDAYKTALGEALASKVIGDKGVITLTHNQGGKINVYVVNGDTETLQTPADGKVLVDWGTQVKIEANADEGYVFDWLKINKESLDVNTYTVRIMRYSPSTVSGQGENFGDITAEASFSVKIATSSGGGNESVTIKGSIDTTGDTQTIIVTHCDKGTESATIPDYAESIGGNIPVTSIAASAFEGCSSLKTVEIPSSITTIGRYAFKDCTSLETFKIRKVTTAMPSTSATRAAARAAADDVEVPEVDEHAFDDIVDKATLYVPEGWKEAFKTDSEWGKFSKIKEYRDDENETVLAELTLTASAGGSLTVGAVTSTNDTQTVKVAEGSEVTVTITPSKGYILSSLLYGGQDVTAQVSGGTLTLTSLEGENTLTAVFGVDTGIGAVYDMSKTVYVRDGRIIIDGAAAGEVVIVCDAAGRVLRREVANGEPIELPMAAGKVYIVRIGKQVIKLTM